jgi:hypothetical protein
VSAPRPLPVPGAEGHYSRELEAYQAKAARLGPMATRLADEDPSPQANNRVVMGLLIVAAGIAKAAGINRELWLVLVGSTYDKTAPCPALPPGPAPTAPGPREPQ